MMLACNFSKKVVMPNFLPRVFVKRLGCLTTQEMADPITTIFLSYTWSGVIDTSLQKVEYSLLNVTSMVWWPMTFSLFYIKTSCFVRYHYVALLSGSVVSANLHKYCVFSTFCAVVCECFRDVLFCVMLSFQCSSRLLLFCIVLKQAVVNYMRAL